MLFVDPSNRRIAANEDGLEKPLTPEGDVFTGTLPASLPVANTSIRWNGRDWAMVMWPLPEDANDRAILLLHESWHRIQERIGFPSAVVDEDHLATLDGRLGMRLELRALARALRSTGTARRTAIADALLFRAWRRTLALDATAHENALELHEGLAEYSGRRLSGDPAMIAHMAERLDQGDTVTAYARSFAYYTGPAYGMLLDHSAPSWRADLRRTRDLGALLAVADHIVMPANLSRAAEKRGLLYGRTAVLSEEQKTARLRARINARWTALLVTGPVIHIPVGSANVAFDPRELVPLPPYGTVYPTITVSGTWGRLKAEHGALLKPDWSELTVARGEAKVGAAVINGDGWALALNPGWTLAQIDKGNALRIVNVSALGRAHAQ
jgi:hypothetical protein